jgi:muramidase (phage lysozyme)
MALSFDDLLPSTSSQPAPVTPPADVSQSNLSKFLDFTSKSEGADYNTIVGGKTFEDYSKHPGVVGLTTPEGPSTAAGRYQITKTTYDDVAAKLGITDFSPESQDKIAQELIRRKGALEDVQAGRYPDAIKKLGKTWASFSSSTYNQPKNTAEKEAKLLAESKGSLSFDDLLPATTTTTSTAKDSKGSLSFDDLLPKEEKQNWLGTGPEMTTEEYFKSGFAGRGITAALQSDDALMKQADDAVVATYGKSIKDNPKKYKDLWNKEYSALKAQETTKAKEEAALNPAPSMGESFKQFGEELVNSPWKTAKSFFYELGKDPELLFLGGGGGAVEAVTGAGKLAKTAQAAKAIGTAAVKPAVTGAALETFAESGNKAGLDPQAIANTAAMFGAFAATMKAGGLVLKAAKTPMGGTPKKPYTQAEFEAELAKMEEEFNTTDTQDSKRIKESSGAADLVQYPTYEAWLKAHKDAGMSDVDITSYIPNKTEFLKQRDLQIQSYIEGPVQDLVKSVWEEGGMPYSSNAYGPGKKGVFYIDSLGKEAFKELKTETSKTDGVDTSKTETTRGHPDLTKENFPELSEVTLKDLNEVGHVLEIDPKKSTVTLDLGNGEVLTIRRGVADAWKPKVEGERFRENLSDLTKNMNPNSMWSDIDFYNMMRKAGPKKESTSKASEEATKILDDDPSLAEAGDIFKDDTTTEQTPVNVIHRVIADTILNNRAARIFKESIERMIPNKKIRERVTMALEGAKETDRLLTDEQKRQTLEGDTPEVREIKEKSGEKIDPGLKGYLSFYQKVSDYLAGYTEALHPKAFDTFWENYTRKHKIQNLSFEKQTEFFLNKKEKLGFTVRMLEELPSEENAIKVLKMIQNMFSALGKQAVTEGVFKQLLQNYVTHMLDFSDSALSKTQQRSLRDHILGGKESRFVRDFAQHRVYKTIRDLEKRLYEAGQEMGIDTRGVKVQRDIAKIAEVYQQSMRNAILQKKAINFLAKQKAPLLNGKQLELLTKDFKVAFENGYVKFTGHGSEVLKDYMVHPDLVDALNHLFNEKDPGMVLKIMSGYSMLSKTITTMASLFHATSLAWARAGATPYGMFKEIGTGFKGTKAALETIRHDGLSKEVDAWTRSGLKFETEDIQQGILPEVAKSVDNFVTKLATSEDVRLTRRVIDPLDAHVLQTLNTFTWDFMHAAGKFATAQYIFAKIKTRNPEMPDHVIRNEVSAFINNTFGGLDWLKIADSVQNKTLKKLAMKAYSNRGRTWMQIAMFAPDWTISTLRSYTKALPKDLLRPKNWEIKAGAKGLFNPKTSGDLARRYVATTALMWLTFLNGINVATSGHYIWENDDPTRIDLGDGTTMQAAKHSMEGPHWLMHPIKTGFNKMGAIPKTVAALGSPYVHTPLDVAKTIAEPFVPFQVSAAIQAPKGEGLKNAALSFVGLPRYGKTNKANTSPEVLMERKKQRKDTMRANKEKKLKRM